MARALRPVLSWQAFLAWFLATAPALAQDAGSGASAEPSTAARWAAVAFGIGAALSFVLFLIALLVRGDALQIESHWGGFGGGLGGWRLSPSAAFLLVTLVLSGLAAMVIMPTEKKKEPPAQQSGTESGARGAGKPAATPTPPETAGQ